MKIETTDAVRLRRLSLIRLGLIYIQFIFGAVLRHTGDRLDAHLLFAGLVTIHIFLLLRRIVKNYPENPALVRLILLLGGLLTVQLTLGFGAYLAEFTTFGEGVAPVASVIITTAHVAIGALMLVVSVVLTLNIFRFTSRSEPAASREFVSDEVSA